ncbi:pentapeptide repeat-containing protein [Catenulispora subtropica]|uniref:Pentapeptide repeat protein n=1 Tax=Catenulispora subtropica TaxID=450798 RepID=A0ABP5BYG5_9ACTN
MTELKDGVKEQSSGSSRRERSKLLSGLLGHWGKEESKSQGDEQPLAYFPRPFAPRYAGLVVAGVVTAIGVYALLVSLVPGMDKDRADTMKTALLVVGGSGALAALYVSYRKQRTDEHNYVRDQDKLFTERYTAAVAQLGNENAAVRLGGVYALARIADDSKRDRPTCLSVLCAYLRMPYDRFNPDANKRQREREVRTTAQGILAVRLRPDHPPRRFWENADVDLSGAYLIQASFNGITARSFNASSATFSGRTSFEGATFDKDASFEKATFKENVSFEGATFEDIALFREATFKKGASFEGATFNGHVRFDMATFGELYGDAIFDGATFNSLNSFVKTVFKGGASFHATFNIKPGFIENTFNGEHPPKWPDDIDKPWRILWEPALPPLPTPGPDPEPPAGRADPPDPT